MKRYCFLLLMIYLASGVGFSQSALRNSDPFGMEEQQNRLELQNEEEAEDKTKIRLNGNRLIIEDLPEDGVLEIYNIMGAKVYNRRVKAGTNQYILSLPRGYYIIKIGKLTRKIVIR